MRRRFKSVVPALTVLLAGTLLLGDDIGGSEVVLCTVVQATRCFAEGDCETGPPWNWNIPQFIEVDLGNKELRTTKASGEYRSTPIKNVEREDGQIFLQGVERQRAFSVAITEVTGMASFAVATEGSTVGAFGACTPIGDRR